MVHMGIGHIPASGASGLASAAPAGTAAAPRTTAAAPHAAAPASRMCRMRMRRAGA